MLKIVKRTIDVDACPLLFHERFDSTWQERWDIRGGEWWSEDGWLNGRNRHNAPAMVVCKTGFPGNVLLEFEARTVPPCTHEIDVMWNGTWDDAANRRGTAYVAGIEGWWEGKIGIEKAPDYALTACTPLFDFNPGETYRVQCGSIDGHCFIFVNGRLMLEVTDPNPIDSTKHDQIGFEAYCSFIQVRDLKVRQIVWSQVEEGYVPEF